jgi:hypothetical protein
MFKEQTHATTGARRWVTSIDGGETWTPGAPRDFSEAAQQLETVDTAGDWWPEIAPDMPRYLHGWKTEINERYANESPAARASYFATLEAYLLSNQALLIPGARRRLPANLLFELIERPQMIISQAEDEQRAARAEREAQDDAAQADEAAAERAEAAPAQRGTLHPAGLLPAPADFDWDKLYKSHINNRIALVMAGDDDPATEALTNAIKGGDLDLFDQIEQRAHRVGNWTEPDEPFWEYLRGVTNMQHMRVEQGKPLRAGWDPGFRPNRLQKGVNQTQEDGRRQAEMAIGISAKDGRRLNWNEYERRNKALAWPDSPAMMKGARAAFAERDRWEDQQAELDQPITEAEQAAADEHGRNVELVMLKTQVRQDEHARRTAAAEAQRVSDVRDVYETMERKSRERAELHAARDARAAELRASRTARRELARELAARPPRRPGWIEPASEAEIEEMSRQEELVIGRKLRAAGRAGLL